MKMVLFGGVLLVLLLGSVGWWNTTTHTPVTEPVLLTHNPSQTALEQYARGEYFFNSGPEADGIYDLAQARHHYERALAEDPTIHERAWYQLGRIDFLEGNFDQSIEHFVTQQEYFGDAIPNVYYMLGLTYGFRARMDGTNEGWKLAEIAFRTYIDEYAYNDWAPRVDLAWVYFAQGKFADMAWPTEEGLLFHPHNPWLLNMYGLMLLNTGDRSGAQTAFLQAQEHAANLSPTDWGESYPGNNPLDWPAGLAAFQEALEKNLLLATAEVAPDATSTQFE